MVALLIIAAAATVTPTAGDANHRGVGLPGSEGRIREAVAWNARACYYLRRVSDEHIEEPDTLRVQGELIELRQRLELANRRIAELEAGKRELSRELDAARQEQSRLETLTSEYQDLLNRNPTTGLPIRRLFDTELNRVLNELARQEIGRASCRERV